MGHLAILRVSLLCLFFLFLEGCATTKLLNADFESDEAGSFPSLVLPDAPTGDRISWRGPRVPSSGSPPLEVAVDTDGSHYLRFQQSRSVPGPLILGFLPLTRDFTRGAYLLQWNGQFGNATNRPTLIKITNGNTFGSPVLLELEVIAPGTTSPEAEKVANVYLGRSPDGESPSRETRIGSVRTDRRTSFNIILNIESPYFTVLAGNINITRDLPVGTTLSNAPSIWISFGAGDFGAYRIEDISTVHTVRTED